MNKYAFLLLLLILPLGLIAHEQKDQTNDEAGVRDLVVNFVSAWNETHDGKKMSALWAEEGDLINPWGKWGTNRAGVEKVLVEDQTAKFKNSTLGQTVEKIRFVKPHIAFVDVTATLTADGKDLEASKYHVVYLLEKKEGQWKILSARAYQMQNDLKKVN